jgi:uncharacterized protein YbaP (TraB family)
MRKLYIVCGLLFLFSFTSNAQTKEKSSLLWEISGNGLKQSSYLFGTVHMICKEDFFFPELLKEKFINAKEAFLEIDMDDPAMMMKMMTMLQLPKGQTIKQLFGDTAFKHFDSSYKKITGSSAVMFNNFKPFMLMSILSEKTLNCSSKESYEQRFMNLSVQYKKDIKGLETIEDQIAVFDSIPDSVEVANLKEMVYNFQSQITEFEKLVSIYKTQNIDSIFSLTQNGTDQLNAEAELLTKRNSNWIPVMKTNMQKASCFFAVGAAHLGGDIGVIALLRKQGFTVKPVKL